MAALVLACLLTAAAPPKASINSLEADLDAISKLIVANAERTSTATAASADRATLTRQDAMRDLRVVDIDTDASGVTGTTQNTIGTRRLVKAGDDGICRSRACADADLTCYAGTTTPANCITSDWCRMTFFPTSTVSRVNGVPFKDFAQCFVDDQGDAKANEFKGEDITSFDWATYCSNRNWQLGTEGAPEPDTRTAILGLADDIDRECDDNARCTGICPKYDRLALAGDPTGASLRRSARLGAAGFGIRLQNVATLTPASRILLIT